MIVYLSSLCLPTCSRKAYGLVMLKQCLPVDALAVKLEQTILIPCSEVF